MSENIQGYRPLRKGETGYSPTNRKYLTPTGETITNRAMATIRRGGTRYEQHGQSQATRKPKQSPTQKILAHFPGFQQVPGTSRIEDMKSKLQITLYQAKRVVAGKITITDAYATAIGGYKTKEKTFTQDGIIYSFKHATVDEMVAFMSTSNTGRPQFLFRGWGKVKFRASSPVEVKKRKKTKKQLKAEAKETDQERGYRLAMEAQEDEEAQEKASFAWRTILGPMASAAPRNHPEQFKGDLELGIQKLFVGSVSKFAVEFYTPREYK